MLRRKLRRNDKAQLHISFQLIFVLVGGILFLTFFFLIIKSMIGGSEASDSRALTQGVNSILYNALPNTNTFDIAKLPADTELYYTCDYYGDSESEKIETSYIGVNSRIPQGFTSDTAFNNIPLFMPSFVKGDRLFTWTIPWKAPYKITNLVLATNNRTKYYFVNDNGYNSDFDSLVNEELPSINKEVISSSQVSSLKDKGFDNYRIIIFSNSAPGTSPIVSNDKLREKTTYLVVRSSAKDFEEGTLSFYDKEGVKQKDFPYIGSEILYAAIISDDYKLFYCNYIKAEQRLSLVKNIIDKRLDDLKSKNEIDVRCKDIYSFAKNKLDINHYDDLKKLNQRLLAYSCPTIY